MKIKGKTTQCSNCGVELEYDDKDIKKVKDKHSLKQTVECPNCNEEVNAKRYGNPVSVKGLTLKELRE